MTRVSISIEHAEATRKLLLKAARKGMGAVNLYRKVLPAAILTGPIMTEQAAYIKECRTRSDYLDQMIRAAKKKEAKNA